MADFSDSQFSQIRDVIHRLQSPVPDLETLLALLTSPLDNLGLLPPRFRKFNTSPLQSQDPFDISRFIPPLQRALLENVIPTWQNTLDPENISSLLDQYFCPDTFLSAATASGEIAVLAYSTILSLTFSDHSIRLLERLAREYPVDRLHAVIFPSLSKSSSAKCIISWEDCIRNACAVPAKVANAREGKSDIPQSLEYGAYFNHLCLRCEALIFSLPSKSPQDIIASVVYLLNKLVNLGVFPPSPPTLPSQPSFFQATLPTVRERLKSDQSDVYSTNWSNIITSLPSLTLQTVLTSLLHSLHEFPSTLNQSPWDRSRVKQEAALLDRLVGPLNPKNLDLTDNVAAVVLGREWTEAHGRIFSCWAAGAGRRPVDEGCLANLLNKVLDMWSSPEHIKHSLLSRHRYVTSFLLVLASYFPPQSPFVVSLALSPPFISGIGVYVSHLDNSVRRCGMLVAEVVAQYAGKKLDFGDWGGDSDGKPWARAIRQLIRERDVDANVDIDEHEEEAPGIVPDAVGAESANGESDSKLDSRVYQIRPEAESDSDDSLTGYASPDSSRSPSPSPSELEEIEKDPTLRVGVKKIPRPVYLAQLGEMVRGPGGLGTKNDNQEANKLEMALDCAEELIRRKRNYGTELEENAINLVYGFVGLQDNYELEDFDFKRQTALNALVSCCPRKAAPSIIEEFFKNQYSTGQRYAMLNALAFAARELASLPIPQFNDHLSRLQERISFPSKTLPSKLHSKYITAAEQSPVQLMLDDISRAAIDRDKDDSVNKAPALIRERRLRIRQPPKVTTAVTNPHSNQPYQKREIAFTEVAAEFFVVPLINRFWLFLRDEQTREERTAQLDTLHRYRGAGSGLILNAVVLKHFLSTLAVLVHAGLNAPEWLAVMAPDALELAVTVGTRPMSQAPLNVSEADGEDSNGKDASVLTSSLELALVVLDGALELDDGRSFSLDHTALLLSTGEWAGQIFSQLEKGALVEGGGGMQEVKLKRAAAGVLLKVDTLTSKWRRSMIDNR